jgi:MFS transporter, DHA3 family, macrolide efflux protein
MNKSNINKNLVFLLTGQFVSLIGDKFYALALAYWVLQTTNSAAMMGTVLLFSMIPSVILGFFIGGFIDSHNRKRILIISDILRGVVISLVIIIYYLNALNLSLIIAAQILLSVCSAFYTPTARSVIPMIVKKDNLTKANANSQLIEGIASIIGPALGGLAVATLGYGFVFSFNAISFFVCALFAVFMHLPKFNAGAEAKIKTGIFEGYKYVLHNGMFVSILIMVGIIHFFYGALQIILPLLAIKLGGNGALNIGSLQTAFGLGAIIAASALSVININGKENKFLFLGFAGIALAYLILGSMNKLGISIIAFYTIIFLCFGSFVIFTATCYHSILQKNIDNKMAGRAFAIVGAIGNISIPIAAFIYGLLLDRMQLSDVVIYSSVILFPVLAVLYVFYNKGAKAAASRQRNIAK